MCKQLLPKGCYIQNRGEEITWHIFGAQSDLISFEVLEAKAENKKVNLISTRRDKKVLIFHLYLEDSFPGRNFKCQYIGNGWGSDWEATTILRFNSNTSRGPIGYPAASACRAQGSAGRDLGRHWRHKFSAQGSNSAGDEDHVYCSAYLHLSLKVLPPSLFSRDHKLKHSAASLKSWGHWSTQKPPLAWAAVGSFSGGSGANSGLSWWLAPEEKNTSLCEDPRRNPRQDKELWRSTEVLQTEN